MKHHKSSTLYPHEINRVKVYPVKCPRYKLAPMARAVGEACPVRAGALPTQENR